MGNEELKLLLERERLTNYILRKENEIFQENINRLYNVKQEIDNIKNTRYYKIHRKLSNTILCRGIRKLKNSIKRFKKYNN